MSARVHDLTETIAAATGGTVVLGRRGLHAGSVWVVVQAWRYGPGGADASPRLVCVHHGDSRWIGHAMTTAQLRDERLWSDIWRVAPPEDAVRGTPAAIPRCTPRNH